MSTGLLGKKELTTSFQSIYVVPQNKQSVVSISLCNKTNASVLVYIGIVDEVISGSGSEESSTNTPNEGEYIEYSLSLESYTSMERAGIILRANQKLVAKSDSSSSISAMVWGYEESI